MLHSSICESLRSLAHPSCINFNHAALCVVLKPKQVSVRFVCVIRFKYTSFYYRFQSFQSLFAYASLSSLVSIAVRIYFNLLQNTGALELNYFIFEIFYRLPLLASVSCPRGLLCSFLLHVLFKE